MSIKSEMSCDAYGCCNDKELVNDEERAEDIGWHTDPNCDESHYCPICWPKVMKELATQSEYSQAQHTGNTGNE